MKPDIKVIGLDADDTLWQNEEFFRLTQSKFEDMLADYAGRDHLHGRLLAAERKNISHYGYGVKGFMLSLIETAIEVSHATIPATVIQEILNVGQELLAHPVHLLSGVAETLPLLAQDYRLVLITKGDLLHQEQKIARSGLADYFDQVEIVSEKSPDTYAEIFGDDAAYAVMVGNSMKSDIVPAIAAGAHAIHIPAKFEWDLEKAEAPAESARFHLANTFADIASILPQINGF